MRKQFGDEFGQDHQTGNNSAGLKQALLSEYRAAGPGMEQ
jgi:hypothetical protein